MKLLQPGAAAPGHTSSIMLSPFRGETYDDSSRPNSKPLTPSHLKIDGVSNTGLCSGSRHHLSTPGYAVPNPVVGGMKLLQPGAAAPGHTSSIMLSPFRGGTYDDGSRPNCVITPSYRRTSKSTAFRTPTCVLGHAATPQSALRYPQSRRRRDATSSARRGSAGSIRTQMTLSPFRGDTHATQSHLRRLSHRFQHQTTHPIDPCRHPTAALELPRWNCA